MRTFHVNHAFVPRDIGGIYFLVDITRKDYYDIREITSLNQPMYLLCTLMSKSEVFCDNELTDQFKALFRIRSKEQETQIEQVVQNCITSLCKTGFIKEIGNG